MDNVTHTYKGSLNPVLHQVNFRVEKGEFCTILGRSGAGKSTFLRAINGFVIPQQGEIFVDNQRLIYKPKALRKVRHKIAMVFQHYNLVNRLTVLENVLCGCQYELPIGRSLLGWFTLEEKRFALDLIHKVGLSKFANVRVDQLSGGQKQRVGIARALAQKPEIILADEPVSSLDPTTANEIMRLLKEINEENNITVLVSLHQVHLAREFGNRIIGFANGRITIDKMESYLTDADLNQVYENMEETETDNERSHITKEKSIV